MTHIRDVKLVNSRAIRRFQNRLLNEYRRSSIDENTVKCQIYISNSIAKLLISDDIENRLHELEEQLQRGKRNG